MYEPCSITAPLDEAVRPRRVQGCWDEMMCVAHEPSCASNGQRDTRLWSIDSEVVLIEN